MATRKIIVLQREDDPSQSGNIHYLFLYWLTVPTARQPFYANASFVSLAIGTETPSTGDLASLRSGALVEEQHDAFWINGTPISQIQSDLINDYNASQARINAYNPWVRYGTSWDGTSWTAKSIA